MTKKRPTKETTDRINFIYKRNRLRRKLRAGSKATRITAPIDKKRNRPNEIIEPLGEQEFEEQMEIGFKREN